MQVLITLQVLARLQVFIYNVTQDAITYNASTHNVVKTYMVASTYNVASSCKVAITYKVASTYNVSSTYNNHTSYVPFQFFKSASPILSQN